MNQIWHVFGWRLLAVSLAVAVQSISAFCPVGCLCDNDTLQVICDDVNLEVIPITLNPSVQVLYCAFHCYTLLL